MPTLAVIYTVTLQTEIQTKEFQLGFFEQDLQQ